MEPQRTYFCSLNPPGFAGGFLFMRKHKKVSFARSLTPPLQIATAALGSDLDLGADLGAVRKPALSAPNKKDI